MTPAEIIERARAWQPIAYLIARAIVYAVTFILGAIGVWYTAGGEPLPDTLTRITAVVGFIAGPLALVNLSRPERSDA